MKHFPTILIVAFAVASAAPGRAQDTGQQPTFRGSNETVRVYATVTGRDGKLVTALTRDQFEVRDDGKPQPIIVFDNSPQPVQLILMLDVSGSMAGNLSLLRSSSVELFNSLGSKDVARVGTFGKDIYISPEFTRDVDALRAALPIEIPDDAPTPLWRAVYAAMNSFDEASDRRRVVLVLSDGKDQDVGFRRRVVTQVDVIDRAREESIMVYAVGLRSRGAMPSMGNVGVGIPGMQNILMSGMPDPGLATTAEETGGGYTEVLPRDDLSLAFAQIVRELHSQYLLGYDPPKRDGKKHKIEVRVTEGGLEPRARKSYVAPKASK